MIRRRNPSPFARWIVESLATAIIWALTFAARVQCFVSGHRWDTLARGRRHCYRCHKCEGYPPDGWR